MLKSFPKEKRKQHSGGGFYLHTVWGCKILKTASSIRQSFRWTLFMLSVPFWIGIYIFAISWVRDMWLFCKIQFWCALNHEQWSIVAGRRQSWREMQIFCQFSKLWKFHISDVMARHIPKLLPLSLKNWNWAPPMLAVPKSFRSLILMQPTKAAPASSAIETWNWIIQNVLSLTAHKKLLFGAGRGSSKLLWSENLTIRR